MDFTMEESLQQHMQPQCKKNHLFPLLLNRISLTCTREPEALSKGVYSFRECLCINYPSNRNKTPHLA